MDALPSRAPVTALDFARFYSSRGWSVVPVRPGEKVPAVVWKPYQYELPHADEIDDWFTSGGYGCGLVQGAVSGTVVLDFDGDEGLATLAHLEAKHGALPHTVRAITPGGGVHVMLRHPGQPVPTRKSLLPGFDVRGDGGFIVTHPSIHPNGRRYAWDVDAHPEDVAVALCPEWVVNIICGEPSESAAVSVTVAQQPGPLGLPVERVTDGREQYMRDTILAVLMALAGRLGRLPHVDELMAEAWPQYEARVDFGRPGRGRDEFAAKVTYTLKRAALGHIPVVDRTTGPLRPLPGKVVSSGSFALGSALPEDAVYKTLTLAEVYALPPPEWLIRDYLQRGSFAVLYAPSESFKSFVAVDMALSVAYGRAWQGQEVRQGTVLYIAAEGAVGLGQRTRAWQLKHGLDGVEVPFRVLPSAASLMDSASTEMLIATIEKIGEEEGGPVALVMVDTVARAMAGADENSARDMGIFVTNCGRVAAATGAAFLGIHHSGKDLDKGARGSSALRAGVDSEYAVKRTEDRLTIVVKKQKDARKPTAMRLRTEEVGVGENASLVLVQDTGPHNSLAHSDQGKRGPGVPTESLDVQIAKALGAHGGSLPVMTLSRHLAVDKTPDAMRKGIMAAIPAANDRGTGHIETGVSGRTVRLWRAQEEGKRLLTATAVAG